MLFRKQRFFQAISTVLYNSYFYGFLIGTIYEGRLKLFPCPGFNCHSCPGAVFACPIGAIQLFISFGVCHLSFYTLGFLGTVGTIGGRIVCGWSCPFGFIQDMLYKIPSPKLEIPEFLQKGRYIVLFFLVILVTYVTGDPWFCRLCPAGTLEAGFALLPQNKELVPLLGGLFAVKTAILIILVVFMVVSKRPFCRTLCPLGAVYSFFNRISFLRLEVDKEKCMECDQCLINCPVSIRVYEEGGNSTNCIRCFRCTDCPTGAVKVKWKTTLGV